MGTHSLITNTIYDAIRPFAFVLHIVLKGKCHLTLASRMSVIIFTSSAGIAADKR